MKLNSGKKILVCSQEFSPEKEKYDLKNNRCCRETGKEVTIPTFIDQSNHSTPDPLIPIFDHEKIPGLSNSGDGIDLDDPARYSRNGLVSDLRFSTPSEYPLLQSVRADACGDLGCSSSNTNKQYQTFATIAERTCCSGHWIRNFDNEENGGGHHWKDHKMQEIPKHSFTCLNWLICSHSEETCGSDFTCDHTDQPDDPPCLNKSTPVEEARDTLNFFR